MINIQLTVEEVNQTLKALCTLPYSDVADLIHKIHNTAVAQVQASTASSDGKTSETASE